MSSGAGGLGTLAGACSRAASVSAGGSGVATGVDDGSGLAAGAGAGSGLRPWIVRWDIACEVVGRDIAWRRVGGTSPAGVVAPECCRWDIACGCCRRRCRPAIGRRPRVTWWDVFGRTAPPTRAQIQRRPGPVLRLPDRVHPGQALRGRLRLRRRPLAGLCIRVRAPMGILPGHGEARCIAAAACTGPTDSPRVYCRCRIAALGAPERGCRGGLGTHPCRRPGRSHRPPRPARNRRSWSRSTGPVGWVGPVLPRPASPAADAAAAAAPGAAPPRRSPRPP